MEEALADSLGWLLIFGILALISLWAFLLGGNKTVAGGGAENWRPPKVGEVITESGLKYKVLEVRYCKIEHWGKGWMVRKQSISTGHAYNDFHRLDGTVRYHNWDDE